MFTFEVQGEVEGLGGWSSGGDRRAGQPTGSIKLDSRPYPSHGAPGKVDHGVVRAPCAARMSECRGIRVNAERLLEVDHAQLVVGIHSDRFASE